MSPELAARQLAYGAWGITVASIGQLQTYRAFGFPRLLLANELIDAAGIAWLAAELAADPGFEAYCYVDSPDGVAILDRVLGQHPAGRPLPVLVEIGHADGRTGCRTDEAALAVAKAAQATGTLTVAGVAGYEGTIAGGEPEVAAFCRRLRALADALGDALGEEGGAPIVTAGGSAYFNVVTARADRRRRGPGAGDPAQRRVPHPRPRVLRHDLPRRARRGGRARAAARHRAVGAGAVAARARPGPARRGPPRRRLRHGPAGPAARACGRDGEHGWARGQVTDLNDQHAYLRLRRKTPRSRRVTWWAWASRTRAPRSTSGGVLVVLNDDDRVIDMVHAFF